jgi:large subunit ribosomal protein L28
LDRFEYFRFSKFPWPENVTLPERARSGAQDSPPRSRQEEGRDRHARDQSDAPVAFPNLKTKRVWVPELKKFVTVKATARAFKTLSKNGAYKTLAEAGVVR